MENPWDNPAQPTDDQAEELIRDLIDGLNKFPETNAKWACCGDTLVATARQRLNLLEVPVFFICTIRKCLMARDEMRSGDSLMGARAANFVYLPL